MLTKPDIRYTDSNFYKPLFFTKEPTLITVTDEVIYDPGRVALAFGFPFNYWPIILRFNGIVDPFEDLVLGIRLLIPPREEFKKLELAK